MYDGTTNILEFLDMVTDVISQQGNTDVIFLEFVKAFDELPTGVYWPSCRLTE